MTTIRSVCHNNNYVLSSFMTCRLVCIKSNTEVATNGAGIIRPSELVFLLFNLSFSVRISDY
jgi:hypothetical protein